MSQEELLLECWRSLSVPEKAQVLQLTQSLQAQHQQTSEFPDLGAPEALKIQSVELLNDLLQEGLDSLERGEGIEVSDEWWEEERARLIARCSVVLSPQDSQR
jgi:hypothetical protein